MGKLKNKLIDKINSTDDEGLLKEVYRLLEIDFDEEVYKLSKEQKAAIQEARAQIEQGDFLTDDEANKATEEWLKRK